MGLALKRDAIDWHVVPERQLAMHDRLINWGRSCADRWSPGVAPGFGLYQSTEANQRFGTEATALPPVNMRDAFLVGRGVAGLPEPHRKALQWYYVKPVNPIKACREIGTTLAGLATLVLHGRMMLINRRV